MKRSIFQALACLVFALLVPLGLWHFFPPEPEETIGERPVPSPVVTAEPAPGETEDRAEATEAPVESAGLRRDADATLTMLTDGETVTLSLAEYLPGVLAGEMPASFAPDALRAQAVAARTYAMYRHRTGTPNHPGADVCDDPGCCQVWLGEDELRALWGDRFAAWYAAVCAAAAETDGQYLAYEGEPILACFHASSAGSTESCAAVWGTALPYLVSVSSPETASDVPNYVSTVSVTAEDLRETVEKADPQADFSGPPEEWVGQRILDTGNRVASLRIGGVALTGTRLRTLFGLRSACFTLTWTGEDFLFTVTGSGHGAGMSQYGANVMAQEGSTWQEILAHYYPGTEMQLIDQTAFAASEASAASG